MQNKRDLSILHLSDTHGKHHQLSNLPQADIIVHSGDVGMAGTEQEVLDFLNWYLDLPYKYKIFVPGNHDNCLLDSKIDGLDKNCFILYNSGINIEGLKFFGVLCFVEFSITGEDDQYYSAIPLNTDILITHQPPYGILDYAGGNHYGSKSLLDRVKKIMPNYHLFGHIHDAYGQVRQEKTHYINSSILDENYYLIHEPHLLMI